jgi:uncharacterized protein YecT (DUF1311 family)
MECEDLVLKNASRELDDPYRQLNNVFSANKRQALKEADEAWLVYRTAHYRSLALPNEPGSMTPVIAIKCEADLTKDRIKILRENFKLFLALPANGEAKEPLKRY